MKPLISVIIPVYNCANFLPRCLDSVLAQTYKNLEIILIDDGSTDNSHAICQTYAHKDTRIKVIRQINSGVCVARNQGLQAATGKYIGFVDADDWVEPDMYAYLLGLCQAHAAPVAVCEYYDFRHTPLFQQEKVFSPREWLALPNTIEVIWAKLFSKELLKDVRFVPSITQGEDHLFSTQVLIKARTIIYGPEKKYHYIVNPTSATQQVFTPNKLTYFQAISLEQQAVENYPWADVHRKVQLKEISGAIRLLRQIATSNYQGQTEITQLLNVLKKNKGFYLRTHAKLTNKFFVLMCCINFTFTAKLYRLLTRNSK